MTTTTIQDQVSDLVSEREEKGAKVLSVALGFLVGDEPPLYAEIDDLNVGDVVLWMGDPQDNKYGKDSVFREWRRLRAGVETIWTSGGREEAPYTLADSVSRHPHVWKVGIVRSATGKTVSVQPGFLPGMTPYLGYADIVADTTDIDREWTVTFGKSKFRKIVRLGNLTDVQVAFANTKGWKAYATVRDQLETVLQALRDEEEKTLNAKRNQAYIRASEEAVKAAEAKVLRQAQAEVLAKHAAEVQALVAERISEAATKALDEVRKQYADDPNKGKYYS